MHDPQDPTRRRLLAGALGSAALAAGPSLSQASRWLERPASAADVGPLQAPDSNGVRLPQGFRSRILAAGGWRVRTGLLRWSRYRWHPFADGGATFPTQDGGWIYVSNSESVTFFGAGAGALRFDGRGRVVDAYRILEGTNANCAGGPTPWGTWLSCEEFALGRVWECDPRGQEPAVVRPALGTFQHEAVAVDPEHGHLYLTEDMADGAFYRFIPDGVTPRGHPDLASGTLQVAVVEPTGAVGWSDVPRPNPRLGEPPTRYQVPDTTPFAGGEGCWYHAGTVYFTTKRDDRVWALDTATQILTCLYDAATHPDPALTGVDNLTVAAGGEVLVAEDGGDMQIVLLDGDGAVAPLLQVVGQDDSEITGPAFDPSGTRLYFSSQRGYLDGNRIGLGITYEVSGPFERFLR